MTLVILVAAVLFGVVSGCPKEICICKWKGGKQTVECGNRNLNTFPDGLDQGTQVLNFSGNALSALKSEWFHKMDLINLQKIFLARNQIARIHNRAFKGLTNLVELDLSENMLTSIPTESFQDYSSLMRLSLNGNPIRELRTAAFKHLSFLTTLELSDCQIESVENEAFVGMDNLEWLRLDGNRITSIRGHHILPDSLHGISLHGNRWACDCRLIDLHNWLVASTVPQSEEPKCAHPTRLAGSTVKSVATGDLACLPEIQPASFFVEIAEGRNLTVACKVSGIPPPSITWWFQGQLLQNDSVGNPGAYLYNVIGDDVDGQLIVAGSGEKRMELFIANTTIETNGTYLCVAENAAGRSQANYTIRVIVKEEPVVEQVKFPYEYFLIIVAGAVCMGVIVLLIVCVLIYKCCCRSGSMANSGNIKASTVKKCHRNSSTSLIGSGTTNTSSGHLGTLSMNSISHTNSGMLLANNGKAGINKIALMNDMDADQMASPKMNGGPVNYCQQDLALYVSGCLTSKGNEDLIKDGQQQQCPNSMGPAQYISPPPSVRNYSPDPINPDLINDAEKNKGRNNEGHLKRGGSMDQQQSDEMAYERSSGPNSLQNEHLSKQLMHSGKTLVSTLPRNGILANNKLAHDLYQHQVDVHLNPSCFLAQSGAAPGFPVEYNMAKIMVPRMPLENMGNYAYRTLPHPARLKIRPTSNSNSVRYARDAEFATTNLANQPQVYDIYTPIDVRYTAEGYPYTTTPIAIASVPAAPIMSTTTTQTNHQMVAYCADNGAQYLPSPPEGYKTDPVVISSSGLMNATSHAAVCSGNMNQQNQSQQWPPCLPGYHHHHQQQQQQHHSQIVPIKTHTSQRFPSPLPSPASSITSSSSSKLSHSSVPTSGGSSCGGGGGGGVNLSNNQQSISKRCVSAQTVSTGSLDGGIGGKEKKESIIMEQQEEEEAEEGEEGGICQREETDLCADNGERIKDCDSQTAENGGERKLRHLNGPLADSPDEGYVGDSQEGSVD